MLDDLLGVPAPEPRPSARPARREAATTAVLRLTINLPVALIERARNAVYHSPGLTLAGLTTAALTCELDRLERRRGQPFPERRGPIRTGRPVR